MSFTSQGCAIKKIATSPGSSSSDKITNQRYSVTILSTTWYTPPPFSGLKNVVRLNTCKLNIKNTIQWILDITLTVYYVISVITLETQNTKPFPI